MGDIINIGIPSEEEKEQLLLFIIPLSLLTLSDLIEK